MAVDHAFARSDVWPSWIANRFQDMIGGAQSTLRIEKSNSTTIKVAPQEPQGVASVVIQGRWRYRTTQVTRAHPGGSAGTYDVFVVASDNDIDSTPDPYTDHTVYDFDLRIVAHSTTPAGVAIYDKIGEVEWSGTAITAIRQLADGVGGASILDGALAATDLTINRRDDGSLLFALASVDLSTNNIAVKTGANAGASAAGIVFDKDGLRTYDGTPNGTLGLLASSGQVTIGALAADTTTQRIEADRTSIRFYGNSSTPTLTWTTLSVADPPGSGSTTPRGQLTTDPDVTKSRFWIDSKGQHAQLKNAGLNGGVAFRTFDFDPNDIKGLRLHTDSTLDAVRLDPVTGITLKLAATDDPTDDLGARWVRQGDGTLAAKAWGDNLGDDTRHGQMNMYAYAKTTADTSQVLMKAQVGTATSPTRYTSLIVTANAFGTLSTIQARAVVGGADSGLMKLIDSAGESDWAQLAKSQTFTVQQIVDPTSDQVSLLVKAGIGSPTVPIQQWASSGGTVLASIRPFGRGSFTVDGISTLAFAGVINDTRFSETPASGTIGVDTVNNRLYVRVGTNWKYAGLGTPPAATFTLPGYTTNRSPTTPGAITLADLARTVYTLIDDLKTTGTLN